MRIKAVSLHQPWASAIALGIKTIETRSWMTAYRGPILIHAAKTKTAAGRALFQTEMTLGRMPAQIPMGCFVATAFLERIDPTELAYSSVLTTPLDRLYGDFRPGRFAWYLKGIVALKEPVPYRGAQGLFSVEWPLC